MTIRPIIFCAACGKNVQRDYARYCEGQAYHWHCASVILYPLKTD